MNIQFNPILFNLPIIVSIVAFFHYVIGLKTWRLNPILNLAFAFYLVNLSINEANISSNQYPITIIIWLITIILALLPTNIIYFYLQKFKSHHYSRLSIIYLSTFIGISLNLIIIKNIFDYTIDNYIVIANILVALVINSLLSLRYRKEKIEIIRRILTTLIISFIGGNLLIWDSWNNTLKNYPLIIVLVLIFDIILATYRNLRLTELLRFKEVIKEE